MESREALAQEFMRIVEWEKDQKSLPIWDKAGRLPFAMLDRLMPKAVKDKLAEWMAELGQFVQEGGKHLVQKRGIALLLQEHARQAGYELRLDSTAHEASGVPSVEELPLSVLDRVADELAVDRSRLAAAQGATTGIGGFVTLAADIPLVIGQSLKVLQEIALCYGYNPDEPLERVFIVKCMQFASSDIVGKQAILEELADYDDPNRDIQAVSQLQGWREVFHTYAESFGWKKLLQIIPVAGILFGSMSNRSTIAGVAEVGKMLYRKRLIGRRLAQSVDADETVQHGGCSPSTT
ncbi:EcsC family protein [Paenibacillus sp. IB182496]|uniref:EcsC family protein n=1 Tax=Paenibacillus sabuli TaxID=2772509 RepID=A0A927BRQ3_9BACL|nr:EcsC family protein [Paenibacillus sabuli]MBD2845548.1 EcsC family protein [Paenibacillus sabuli]